MSDVPDRGIPQTITGRPDSRERSDVIDKKVSHASVVSEAASLTTLSAVKLTACQ